jgi:hypothetical protein
VLDAELFLRPQYVLRGETQFVSVIMISHGKRLWKNVGLRVKCLLRLTDFNQNRNVQTNFNKSLNVNFLVKFSDGRHFFPYSLAGVTKLTISFHVCFSSAPKIFILCFFWLNFNPQSLPSSHVVCLGFYRFFSLQSRVLSSIINLLAPELFFLVLAHSVYKMWKIQEPNTLELWNKLHFEEKKNGEFIPSLKLIYFIYIIIYICWINI